MDDSDQIIQLLTEIRDAQRAHLEEHKSYLAEAREHNSWAKSHTLTESQELKTFRKDVLEQQLLALRYSRRQGVAIILGVGVLVMWGLAKLLGA